MRISKPGKAQRKRPPSDPMTREHRRKVADARPLTDAQRTALHRSQAEKGTRVRPASLGADTGGVAYSTALVLVRRGLATMACQADGDGLTLDRHDRYVDAGRLFITPQGRAELRRVTLDEGETLARIGKSDADEHGHYVDGRDPLDAGAYVDPASLKAEWATSAARRKAEAEDKRARARRVRYGMRRAA
jgi:hypothetical protein